MRRRGRKRGKAPALAPAGEGGDALNRRAWAQRQLCAVPRSTPLRSAAGFDEPSPEKARTPPPRPSSVPPERAVLRPGGAGAVRRPGKPAEAATAKGKAAVSEIEEDGDESGSGDEGSSAGGAPAGRPRAASAAASAAAARAPARAAAARRDDDDDISEMSLSDEVGGNFAVGG